MQHPSGPTSTRQSRILAARSEPSLNDIIPPRDMRLYPHEAVAWSILSHSSWPSGALQNPYFVYLVARRNGRLLEQFTCALPHLLVLALQLTAVYASGLGLVVIWPTVCLIGPLLLIPFAGLITMIRVLAAFERNLGKGCEDELLTCPFITPQNIVYTTGAISMMGAAAGYIVSTMVHIAMWMECMMTLSATGPQAGVILMGVVAIILIMLHYQASRNFVNHAAVLSIRGALLYQSPLQARSRVIREYFGTWQTWMFLGMPIILPILFFVTAQMGVCVIAIFALAIPTLIATMLSSLEEKTGEILEWIVKVRGSWRSFDGESRSLDYDRITGR